MSKQTAHKASLYNLHISLPQAIYWHQPCAWTSFQEAQRATSIRRRKII